ncbi:MAG: DUF4920 domain-containing protein [Weeksellaceae bacterium]
MKYLTLVISSFMLFSCNQKEGKKVGDYISYGNEINTENVISQEEMMQHYSTMKPGDTVAIKFKSNIKEVCQMEGCWVKLDLESDTESMVNYKNHDFSIPKDSKGKEAIVEGKAFIKEVSVEDQKHYAADAGDSEEEIASITSPKSEYHFIADGILVK